jgi:hypothetical protein
MAPQATESPVRTWVHEWNREIGVPFLDVTTRVFTQPSTSQLEPSTASGAARFGVEVGSGMVSVQMKIAWPEHHAPRHPSAPAGTETVVFQVPYECTAEGDPEELPPGNDFKLPKPQRLAPISNVIDSPLSVAFYGYFWTEHPDDPPKTWVPTKVMHDWMKQLNILHIVVHTTVTLGEEGKGKLYLEYKDKSVAVPTFTAGSTGARTARLPSVEIILDPIGMPPPITTQQGLQKRVYFEVDSSELNKIVKEAGGTTAHQAGALDEFISDMYSRWEVIAALEEKKVRLFLEARASATYKGMSESKLSRSDRPAQNAREYNQKLSEKRMRAVVDRLLQTTSLPGFSSLGPRLAEGKTVTATAIGMFGAIKLGEENPMDRRCEIKLDGAELVKYIKGAFGRKPLGRR